MVGWGGGGRGGKGVLFFLLSFFFSELGFVGFGARTRDASAVEIGADGHRQCPAAGARVGWTFEDWWLFSYAASAAVV